jgi:cytidylate kinase
MSNAQEKYAVVNLTAEFTEKSNSVILRQDIRVTIDDYDDMTIRQDQKRLNYENYFGIDHIIDIKTKNLNDPLKSLIEKFNF